MISDSDLKLRILDEFVWDPQVSETHIGVTTSDGSVTLTGHVHSYTEKCAAVAAAARVRGVKAVADEITVDLDTKNRNDDGMIAEHIAHVLKCNVSIPDNQVQAKVHGGFVTLTGEVDWQHQRIHVGEQVRHVSGIRGIKNSITLRPRATPDDVTKAIEDAISRSSDQRANNIQVTVLGETVTLDGTVETLHERDLIERAAWKAPGLRFLIDNIRVG